MVVACLDVVGLYGVAVEGVGGGGGGGGMVRAVALAGWEGEQEKEEEIAGHFRVLWGKGMRVAGFF